MPPAAFSQERASQKWALLVGVDDYVRAKDLRYCVADQQALADQLTASGFPQDQVFLLHDKAAKQQFRPFKSNIEEQLKLVLSIVEPGDTIIVGFSGHGVHVEGKSYLCPADARFDDAQNTMVPLNKVYDALAACPATLKLLMVDACRNDPRLGGERSLDPQASIRGFGESLERPPEGITLLASCSPGQTAREDDELGHGVFMHFVLEGLRGKAADDEGLVSLMRLADYTSRETKKYVARRFVDYQTPYFRGEIAGPVELVRIDPIKLLPPVPAETPKPVAKPVDPALEYKIIQLSEKVRVRPGDVNAWNDRGLAWWEKGEYDKAIADFTQALIVHPNDAVVYNNMGLAWADKREYHKALVNYAESIRLDPKKALTYLNRAVTWRKMGNYDYALKDLNYSIRLKSNDASAYNQRGITWDAKKEYDKAIADYSQAIRLDPTDDDFYYNRGTTWHIKKEYDKAIADFNQAVRLNPKYAAAYDYRGDCWRIKAVYDKAIADYDESIRLDPQYKFPYNDRGLARYEIGDFDGAIADFTEAIRLDPKYLWAYTNRGNAWERKGNHNQAIADFNEAIRIDPKFASGFAYRAWALNRHGKYEQALANCDEAIRLDPKLADPHRHRGTALEKKGQYREAIAAYSEAIRLLPDYVRAYANLATVYATCPDENMRDGKKALDLAKKAVGFDKYKLGDPYAALAAAHAELGDFKQAVEMQTKAIELFHDVLEKRIAEERLALYKAGTPYRELPADSAEGAAEDVATLGESE
jgi:tetratricopeptide (TPR) repeat protein